MSGVLRRQSLLSDSASRSHSSYSEVSGRSTEGIKKNKFRRGWHFVVAAISYCISSQSYSSFLGDDEDSPNIIQDLTTCFFLGMPIMYMHIALGQYTQMGLFYLRHCVPLFKGLGYTFLFSVLIESIMTGFVMTDELLYFLLSIQKVLPWSKCPNEYKYLCTLNKTSSPGMSNYSHTAFVYWRYVYMNDPTFLVEDVTTFDIPSMQRIVGLLVTWTITYGVVCTCYFKHRKIIRVIVICYLVGQIILIFSVVLKTGAAQGLSSLLQVKVTDFYSLDLWCKAVKKITKEFALAELYFMYAGAKLLPTAQVGALTVSCVFSLALLRITVSAIGSMCEGMVLHYTTYSTLGRYQIRSESVVIFITIPLGLSYLSLPQLWTVLYFILNVLISLCNQVLHLLSIHMAINDVYSNFYKFRVYVFGVICIFNMFMGLCLMPDSVFALREIVFLEVQDFFQILTVLLLTVTIFWLYGVTSLSDDIHFISGSQPTKYWKICWHITPIIMTSVTIYSVYMLTKRSTAFASVTTVSSLLLMSPVIALGILVILGFIKKGNLLGTIRPTELWGPPDPGERALRRMFNPRLETRFEAHKMICQHSCLFGNKVLKNVYNQEHVMRREYLINLMETKGISIKLAPEF